ncbi:DNA-formamidopyrimidine glycosylase [Candidatus Falkowbacteria bacterium]|jgi:formamidopyrimidine-DNA glycosylase|nr:DNA-formamidopyrimidine glycosylase [Candidatus Falkowbacteria bacterium]
MPELPEVQTIINDLRPLLLNKSIAQILIIDQRLNNLTKNRNQSLIINQPIVDLFRRAKNLVIQLANNYYLVIHLKMTGQLVWTGNSQWLAGGHPTKDLSNIQPQWPNKSTRAILKLSDQSQLFFNDIRKFGWLKLMNAKEWMDYQAPLGLEPLGPDFSLLSLKLILQKKAKTKLKSLLLDQHYLVGIGNIYADESLFAARLKPDRLAGSLKALEIKKLYQAIISILTRAVAARGTSFSDYRDGRGKLGNFLQKLQVYGRSKQNCLVCGQPINKIKLAGRGTHFCSNCQK